MAGWDYGKTPNVWRPAEVQVPGTGADLGLGAQPVFGEVYTETITEYGYPPLGQSGEEVNWTEQEVDTSIGQVTLSTLGNVIKVFTAKTAAVGPLLFECWGKCTTNASQAVTLTVRMQSDATIFGSIANTDTWNTTPGFLYYRCLITTFGSHESLTAGVTAYAAAVRHFQTATNGLSSQSTNPATSLGALAVGDINDPKSAITGAIPSYRLIMVVSSEANTPKIDVTRVAMHRLGWGIF